MRAANGLTAILGIAFAAMLWTAMARGEEAFSPRGYCQVTGGTVRETRDPEIYICCYAAKQRCLAVNLGSQTSIRVMFPLETMVTNKRTGK